MTFWTRSSTSASCWRTWASSRLAMSRTWPRGSMQPVIVLATGPRSSTGASRSDSRWCRPPRRWRGRAAGAGAVAVEGAGAGERVGDLEELLGGQLRADGGPADDEADVVQPGE